jgi:hypothetical protein
MFMNNRKVFSRVDGRMIIFKRAVIDSFSTQMTQIGRIFTANLCLSVRSVSSVHLRAVLAGILLILPLTSLYAAPEKPVISRQPAGATYSKNATARFYVNAYSIDGGYLEYQWYRSQLFSAPESDINVIKTGATPLSGGIAATLITTAPTVTGTQYCYYWVKITNNKDGDSDFIESAFALTRIVDRTLEPQLMNGDFESGSYSLTFTAGGTSGGSPYWETVPVDVANKDWLPYWNSTQNTTRNDDDTGGGSSYYSHGKAIELHQNGIGVDWTGHGKVSAELCEARKSSIYQDIATLPGKVYEWSLDQATRGNESLAEGDVMAVVIGSAINETSDYDASVMSRWKADVTVTRNFGFSHPYNGTYTWSYPYG